MQSDYEITPAAIPIGEQGISDGVDTWRNRVQRLWDWLRRRPLRPKIDTRHIVTIIFGKSFFLSELGINSENDPTGERATTAIMVRIGSMLPKNLWGEYASAIADYLKSDEPHADYYRNLRASLSLLG